MVRGRNFFPILLTLLTAHQKAWLGVGAAHLTGAAMREGLSSLPSLGRTPAHHHLFRTLAENCDFFQFLVHKKIPRPQVT